MNAKKIAQAKRSVKTRKKIATIGKVRLTVFKSHQHIYAQLFSSCGSKVLAAASSVEKAVRDQKSADGKIGVAKVIGKMIAERAKDCGVSEVAFDRSGFKYHGRLKALAEAAREAGLVF